MLEGRDNYWKLLGKVEGDSEDGITVGVGRLSKVTSTVPVFLLMLFSRTAAGTNEEFLTFAGTEASTETLGPPTFVAAVTPVFDDAFVVPACRLPSRVESG